MSAQHGHGYGLFEWLRTTFGWPKEHKPTGWQREREEEQGQQDTGGYQLPDILSRIADGNHWPGAPGTWRSVYFHEPPHRRRGDTPIPETPYETGPQRKICHTGRLRKMEAWEVPTNPQRPGPDWLYANVPTGALPECYGNAPVRRQQTGPIRANTGRLDGMMVSFLPQVQDLPTVPNYNKIVSDKLAALPPVVPLPAEMVAAFQDDAWINDMPQTVLNRQPTGSLAVADKTACNPLGVTSKDCQPNLDDVTPTEECPRVRFEKIIRQLKKESE